MKKQFDLSQVDWQLTGWIPYLWAFSASMEIGAKPDAVVTVPAMVPGSVQKALQDAGELPDWNAGLNARECEWVENRHWIYETVLPDEWVKGRESLNYRLVCLGLDYCGWIYLNGKEIGSFCGTHVPHSFDLSPHLKEKDNCLRIVFDLAPRWLGQCGYTSRMTEWKTRFNYTWDWQPRLVQLGIWDSIYIEATDRREIESVRCTADADVTSGKGLLKIVGKTYAAGGAVVRVRLSGDSGVVREGVVCAAEFNAVGVDWQDLDVELWWPNLEGDQPLYTVSVELLDASGNLLYEVSKQVGFRNVLWKQCDGAPEGVDPWVCVVNGRPVFLQGVNFPPVRANYADVTREDYRKRLELYRDLGANVFRINACGFLEKSDFYELCDELGLMVWQEFPLTSSGAENFPPVDEASIKSLAEIAESFIERRHHHPSLIMWGGGNELLDMDMRPVGAAHPMLARLKKVVAENDPGRRFLHASPSGPRFCADAKEFGKGVNVDVHGPWKLDKDFAAWEEYFAGDDALFRSELGCPGAAPVELIRKYCGGLCEMPIEAANPFWRNPVRWWIENEAFAAEKGHEPESLEEYVEWSQERQAKALSMAVKACKERFPACGGVILWMGHDSSPCPTNTSIIDFEAEPKPAAIALKSVWRNGD